MDKKKRGVNLNFYTTSLDSFNPRFMKLLREIKAFRLSLNKFFKTHLVIVRIQYFHYSLLCDLFFLLLTF